MLIQDPDKLLEVIKTSDMSVLTSQEFSFTYGPMMAVHPKLYKYLDDLCLNSPYYIPFKYIGYFRNMCKNASATEIKAFMKKVTIDLDNLAIYYKTSGVQYKESYLYLVSEKLKKFIQDVILHVRDFQKTNGVLESAVMNYAPIVPYESETMRKAWLASGSDKRLTLDFITSAKEFAVSLKEFRSGRQSMDEILTPLLMSNINGIIAYQNIGYKEIHDLASCFDAITREDEAPDTTRWYWAFVWAMNHINDYSDVDIENCFRAYETLYTSRGVVTDSTFSAVFESISSAVSPEAWMNTPAQDRTDVVAAGDCPKLVDQYKMRAEFDLDRFMAEIYNMRHIEFTEAANQQFLSESEDISSYSPMGNDMILCEIGENTIAVPFIDIADDYKLKAIAMFRTNGEIQVFDMEHWRRK